MSARGMTALALTWICLRPTLALAQDQTVDDGATLVLRYSLKSSLLLSRLPDDPVLFPDRGSATGFWRARVEPTLGWGRQVIFDAAFEQRVRLFSSASSVAGANVLPSDTPAPFRIRQLDWRFASASNAEWRG